MNYKLGAKTLMIFSLFLITFGIILMLVSAEDVNYIYLSDIEYEKESYTAWGSIKKDKNIEDGVITLKYDNETISFNKGIGAHANSSLIYNISEYSNEYTNFIAYLGVDYSKGSSGNGVKFEIFTSLDKITWNKVYTSSILKGNTNYEFVNIDVKDIKYLKLNALDNGNNGTDHSVYGDARLLKEGYDIKSELVSDIKTVVEYDSEIKNLYNGTMTDEIKSLTLKRTFVNRFGYQTIQQFAKKSAINRESLLYIFQNEEVLNYFVTGGTIDRGTYASVLNAWSSIYANFKDDFIDYRNNDKDNMYLKLAVSLSLVNSRGIGFWTGFGIASVPTERYAIYKYMIEEKRFDFVSTWSTERFANLPIENMRWVVNNMIHDDEIVWLSDTAMKKATQTGNNPGKYLDAYYYIRYTMGYNYNKDEFYDEANYTEWNNTYNLDNIKFPEGVSTRDKLFEYGTRKYHRLWMVFKDGSVCGGLAKTYANLAQTFGIPAAVIGQPGHAASLRFGYDSNGNGVWSLLNDVSGWASSEKSERMPLAWGSSNWDSYYMVSYILLAQHALNEYDILEQSMYYNYLADSYIGNTNMQIEIYSKALEIEPANLDSYVGLINAYKNDSTKTSSDYLSLARKIVENYTYFPLPMTDLLNLIKDKMTIPTDLSTFEGLKTDALQRAVNATSNDTIQPGPCQQVAKALVGKHTTALATFSFDGENAGKIILNEKYDDSGVRVRYTLSGIDNNTIYTETSDHIITLTEEQIASINAEDDIVVGLVGSDYNYVIDIKNTNAPTANKLYANDYENRFIGEITALEFSLDDGSTWCDYTDSIRFTGNKNVLVRYKAHETNLASNTTNYTFTQDVNNTQETYISKDHITLHSYSSQQNTSSQASHMLDATVNTSWHNTWKGEVNKFISVKFDDIKYISSVYYLPAAQNGRFKSVNIYSSMDGENWSLVKEFKNLANNTSWKSMKFDDSVATRYMKIQITESYGNTTGELNKYASGKLLYFFEDTTKEIESDATVTYNINTLTNKDVQATVSLPDGAVTSESLTYKFIENGVKYFHYTNIYGEVKTLEINVDWIDKVVPTAEVEYIKVENGIKAILKNISEEITVTNTVNNEKYYLFTENKTFTFKIKDKAGNENEIVAVVDDNTLVLDKPSQDQTVVPTPSSTPTPSNTPVPSSTPVPAPSNTPVPSSTPVPAPTSTPAPSFTPSASGDPVDIPVYATQPTVESTNNLKTDYSEQKEIKSSQDKTKDKELTKEKDVKTESNNSKKESSKSSNKNFKWNNGVLIVLIALVGIIIIIL